jgi:hypothetical protein
VGVIAVGIGLLVGVASSAAWLRGAQAAGWKSWRCARSDFAFAFPALLTAIMLTRHLRARAS